MRHRRSLTLPIVSVLVALVLLPLTAGSADAAAKRCVTKRNVERCASIDKDANAFMGTFSANAKSARVTLRIDWVALQRRRADGTWRTLAKHTVAHRGFFSGDTAHSDWISCSDAARGVYRARGRVIWKVRGRTGTKAATHTSKALRRSRLCD